MAAAAAEPAAPVDAMSASMSAQEEWPLASCTGGKWQDPPQLLHWREVAAGEPHTSRHPQMESWADQPDWERSQGGGLPARGFGSPPEPYNWREGDPKVDISMSEQPDWAANPGIGRWTDPGPLLHWREVAAGEPHTSRHPRHETWESQPDWERSQGGGLPARSFGPEPEKWDWKNPPEYDGNLFMAPQEEWPRHDVQGGHLGSPPQKLHWRENMCTPLNPDAHCGSYSYYHADFEALRGSQDFGKRGISWSPPTSPPERELTGLGHPVKPKLSPDVTLPYRYVCACAQTQASDQATDTRRLLGVQGHE